MPRFIELSHEIVPGMKTYPGLPEPRVDVEVDYEASRQRYQNQAEFYIANLHLCGNTGTYVDSPRHRYRDGMDLAGLPLGRLANLPTVIVDATQAGRSIGSDNFRELDLAGRAILFVTVYRVEARLLWLFTEADNDYHLVLASPRDTTLTMIAEVPDPGCAGACASGFASVYAQVRQKLLDYLNSPQSVARPLVRITGVGFFDYIHGQRGVAPNGIELHPVLAVEFP